jgi:predicted ATP-grasp superfamily ATP-dependent carboligase
LFDIYIECARITGKNARVNEKFSKVFILIIPRLSVQLMHETQKILLVGVDLSSLAISARKAGFEVYTVDYFGDVDLKKLSNKQYSIINQTNQYSSGKFQELYDPKKFVNMVKKLSQHDVFDGILLSSGLDDAYKVLTKLNTICKIIGNSPEVIKEIRNREKFYDKLKKLNINQPKTKIVDNMDDATVEAKDIGYPIMIKPSTGFGGSGIRKVTNAIQLVKEFHNLYSKGNQQIILQEFIEGTPTSISFLAAYPESSIVSLNEQLLGLENIYQPEPFGYCGNITPYYTNESTLEKYYKIVEKISRSFKLAGSNGIDVTLTRDNIPYVIEVNPRFQGSIGCIERVFDINLVKMHISACEQQKLPQKIAHSSRYSTRLILYTPKKIIAPNLVSKPCLTDIPFPGSIIEKGEPFCSIFTEGETRNQSYSEAKKIANNIYNIIL